MIRYPVVEEDLRLAIAAYTKNGEDWFELHNSGASPVALAALWLSDTPGTPKITQVPALSYIAAGGFTRFEADGTTEGGNRCNFKLSAGGESVVLTAGNGITQLDRVNFGSQAADLGLEMDQQILSVKAPTERWHKELMWLPGFLLFGVIVWLQRRRAVRP